MADKDNSMLYIVAILGIVAIVGMIVLVMNSQSESSGNQTYSIMDVEDENGELVGQVIKCRGSGCPGYTERSVREGTYG